uniref:Uncharacterized protein n=1 Tax=Cyclocybe aegerita TaxID=1973307 RepID=O78939_CYCAE|nr:unknown [Cyclocybe aegerita]
MKYLKVFTLVRFIIKTLASINLAFSVIILYCFSDFTFNFDWIGLIATSGLILDSLQIDASHIMRSNSSIDYIKNMFHRTLRKIYNIVHDEEISIKDNKETKNSDSTHPNKDNSINYTKYIIIGVSVGILSYVGYYYHEELAELIISTGFTKFILDYFKKDDKGKGKDSDSSLYDILPTTWHEIPSTKDSLFNDKPSDLQQKLVLIDLI